MYTSSRLISSQLHHRLKNQNTNLAKQNHFCRTKPVTLLKTIGNCLNAKTIAYHFHGFYYSPAPAFCTTKIDIASAKL